MSMYTITEGRIAQPELRFTSGQNRPVLEPTNHHHINISQIGHTA